MTVKIKDKYLYDKYLNCMNPGGDKSFSAYDFLKHVRGEDGLDEVQAVVNAIFDGEKVELDEQKYRVPLPDINGGQVYLVKYDEIGAARQPVADPFRSELTMDEIPEEYRKWAKKVEE